MDATDKPWQTKLRMLPMKPIVIVCPPNTRFSADGASAIDLNVRDAYRFSRLKDHLHIIGPEVETPFEDVNFIPVPRAGVADYAAAVLDKINDIGPGLVEFRQHMRVAKRVARGLKDTKTLVFRHRQLTGPKGRASRFFRTRRLRPFTHFTFVSHFAQETFAKDYPSLAHRSGVTWNGLDTEAVTYTPEAKEKIVVFAGRVIPNKGVLEFAEAAATVLTDFPDWRAIVIGEPDEEFSTYGEAVKLYLSPLKGRGEYWGYRSFAETMVASEKAEIVVVPSILEETFGRTAMEAMAGGAALISSGRGGLKEVSGDHALYVDAITPQTIGEALRMLIKKSNRRLKLQREGRKRAEDLFDIRKTVSAVDDVREKVMG